MVTDPARITTPERTPEDADLGFKPADARAAVNAAHDELGDGATLDALGRLALRKAAK